MADGTDIREISDSFEDMVRRYATFVKASTTTAGSEIASSLLKTRLRVPDGVPKDVEDQAMESTALGLKCLGMLYFPRITMAVEAVAERVSTAMSRGLDHGVGYVLHQLSEDAARLAKVAEAAGIPVEDTRFRLVKRGITFTEIVHGRWQWSGTLVEARLRPSALVLTPIQPGDYFAVYVPPGSPVPGDSNHLKVVRTRLR